MGGVRQELPGGIHTNVTTFYANYDFHRCFQMASTLRNLPPMLAMAHHLHKNWRHCNTLPVANAVPSAIYQETTNKSWSPAPAFEIRDCAFLSTKNTFTTNTTHKLDWKELGHFSDKIVSYLPYAYELKLLPSINPLPVFHV